jgi:hypothetical protein
MPPISILSSESDRQIERLFAELESLVAVSDQDQRSLVIADVTESLEGFMGIERDLLAQVLPALSQRPSAASMS